ncbi:MAG: TolC family protein [Rikenellaceae bacterium]|nr:TolC family protein [Rikenellaceae bacterium]
MKKIKWMLTGIGSLFFVSAGWGQELLLTLDQALEIALSENLTVQIADVEIEKAGYARKGTYASLFPQVDFSADYQRNIKKQVMYMDTGAAGEGEDSGGSSGITVGRDNNWSTGFSVSMPLVSPTLWKSLQISALDVEIAVEQARASRIDMVEQVTTAFYTVLLAKDSYEAFHQTYQNAVTNHENIQKKYEMGLVSEYDVIRSNVTVINAEPNVYDAENAVVLALWRLKALIGIDLELEIDCMGSLADYEPEVIAYHSRQVSLQENTSLRQLELQRQQWQKTWELKRAEYYPTLSLGFNYQWTSMNDNFRFNQYNWNPYSVGDVTLSIPLFSGGKRLNDMRQAKANIRQAELQLTETERNLEVSAIQYLNNMATNARQFQAAYSGIDQAQMGYDISVKMYETGSGNLVEINDAQLALTQSQLNLNQSIYDFLINKTSLESLTGKAVAD